MNIGRRPAAPNCNEALGASTKCKALRFNRFEKEGIPEPIHFNFGKAGAVLKRYIKTKLPELTNSELLSKTTAALQWHFERLG